MSAAAPKFAPHPHRRAMTAKLHLARKELGLSEVDYRAVLERVTGKTSAADLNDRHLEAALDEFKRQGWQQKKGASRPADHPSARKARALWISLHQLGVVRNPSEKALEAFACKQMHCEQLQWADQAKTYKLIEALKAMATCAGWDQDVSREQECDQSFELQRRLVLRLHELLVEADPAAPALNSYAAKYAGAESGWLGLWERNLQRLAQDLAKALAEAKAAH